MFLSQLLLAAMVGIGRSHAEDPTVEQLHDAEPAINAVLEQLRGTTPSKAGAGIAIADAHPSNSMDVIKSAIGDAAENGRNLRTLSDDTGYWTACGRNGSCSTPFASAMPSDLNYVRCCSDIFREGWVKQGDQCPYGESNLELYSDYEHKWDEGCAILKDYAGARDTCSDAGARLCTKAELHFDCAARSGCGSDTKMVWALSSEASSDYQNPMGRARMRCCVSVNSDGSCNISNGTLFYGTNTLYRELNGNWRPDDNGPRFSFSVGAVAFFDACANKNGHSLLSHCTGWRAGDDFKICV